MILWIGVILGIENNEWLEVLIWFFWNGRVYGNIFSDVEVFGMLYVNILV